MIRVIGEAPLPSGSFSLALSAPIVDNIDGAKFELHGEGSNSLLVSVLKYSGSMTLCCKGFQGPEDDTQPQFYNISSFAQAPPLTSVTLDFTVSDINNGKAVSVASPEATGLKLGACSTTLQSHSTITAYWYYEDVNGTHTAELVITPLTSPMRLTTVERARVDLETNISEPAEVVADWNKGDGRIILF
ncbi:hypothetical protein RI367_006483 [Sorochytrium milnesiophthora]